uniref:SHSP domain-containing protein n=1 Tax=Plectus sambesii TaxID=2011161 RepID=A0A914WVU4_9BILA
MSLYRNRHYPLSDDWWDFKAPERLFDQFIGEPITGPHHPSVMYHHPMSMVPYYMRPVRRADSREADELGTGFSDVHNDAEQFAVRLDVSHFKPEEVTVSTTDNTLVVKAHHEEKLDEHGYIQRSFARKYVLPKECNLDQVKSQLSRDGVLTISTPKLAIEGKQERVIPISAAPNEEKKAKTKKQEAVMNGH